MTFTRPCVRICVCGRALVSPGVGGCHRDEGGDLNVNLVT